MKQLYAILLGCLAIAAAQAQEPQTFLLTNSTGMEATVSNYGARLMSLTAHNWNGRLEPIVKGFDNPRDYHQLPILGATLADYNSVATDPLADNTWEVLSADRQTVAMRCTIPCGEPSRKGTMTVSVTYTLTDQNALDIDYRAVTTQPTPIRLSNGIVFNLSGDGQRTVLRQHLWLDASRYHLPDGHGHPSGILLPVRNSPLNFLHPRELGERIQLLTDGYCHDFQLRHTDSMQKPSAILFDPQSGRAMTLYTSEPSLRINTYGRHSRGLSFQPIHDGYSSSHERLDIILQPGQVFHSATVYLFTTDPPLIMRTHQP